MNRSFFFLLMVILVIGMIAYPASAQLDAAFPEPTQNPDANFRIFRTQNIYTLLKLDTRTGQVWQIQWGDVSHKTTVAINLIPLIDAGTPDHPTILKAGRFTLSPTYNIHVFILLDVENGKTWQVQWSDDTAHRFIQSIP